MFQLFINIVLFLGYLFFIIFTARFLFRTFRRLKEIESRKFKDLVCIEHITKHFKIAIAYLFLFICYIALLAHRIYNNIHEKIWNMDYFRSFYELCMCILAFMTIKHFCDEQRSDSKFYVCKNK